MNKMNIKDKIKNTEIEKSHDTGKISSNKEYLLITYTESGDEIHFLVLDNSYYQQIQEFLDNFENGTLQDDEEILDTILENKEAELMCQTFVLEDFSKINKYNIVKCINLPVNGL